MPYTRIKVEQSWWAMSDPRRWAPARVLPRILTLCIPMHLGAILPLSPITKHRTPSQPRKMAGLSYSASTRTTLGDTKWKDSSVRVQPRSTNRVENLTPLLTVSVARATNREMRAVFPLLNSIRLVNANWNRCWSDSLHKQTTNRPVNSIFRPRKTSHWAGSAPNLSLAPTTITTMPILTSMSMPHSRWAQTHFCSWSTNSSFWTKTAIITIIVDIIKVLANSSKTSTTTSSSSKWSFRRSSRWPGKGALSWAVEMVAVTRKISF